MLGIPSPGRAVGVAGNFHINSRDGTEGREREINGLVNGGICVVGMG